MEANNAVKNKVFCSSCGAANLPEGKFCSNCGAMIVHISAPDRDQAGVGKPVAGGQNKGWVKWVKGIVVAVATYIGYQLGSSILTGMSYTSWERHVVATNTSGYTSGLRDQYASTALAGGIIGAIVLFAISLLVIKLLSRKG